MWRRAELPASGEVAASEGPLTTLEQNECYTVVRAIVAGELAVGSYPFTCVRHRG